METSFVVPGWLVYVGSLITVMTVVCGFLWRVGKPHLERFVLKTVEDHDRRLDDHETRITELDDKKLRDFDRFKDQGRHNVMVTTALFAILSHLRTGNSTGAMDEAITELQDAIIKSKGEIDG